MSGSTHQRESERIVPTIVRYRAKPESAEENQRLIEAVFTEIEERQLDGFTYKVFRLGDGVSFIHVMIEHDDVAHPDSVEALESFQAFTADLAERCDTPTVTMGATVVGGYR